MIIRCFPAALLGLFVIASTAVASPPFPESCKTDTTQRSFALSNGLKVLLESDPSAKSAHVALDVAIGSRDEPEDILGLAHFVEHMLFMGSEKYPESNSYKHFLATFQGEGNATTDFGHTNYYFYLQSDHLEEALTRFADQFIAPRFDTKYVNLERQAMQAEFSYRKDILYWKLTDLVNTVMGGDKFPATRFNMGNNESLKNWNSEWLAMHAQKWFQSQYRADKMALVVTSSQSLEQMSRWVEENFSTIPAADKTAEAPATKTPMYIAKNLPVFLETQLNDMERYLQFYFPVSSKLIQHESASDDFVANLLTQKLPGTLAGNLANGEWADGVEVNYEVYSDEQAMIAISIDTYYKGGEQYWEVARRLFAYIELLRSQPIEEWRFREFLQLQSLKWCKENGFSVSTVAGNLNRYGADYAQAKGVVASRFAPDTYDELLSAIRPDNMVMIWVHPDASTNRITKWFGVPYSLDAYDSAEAGLLLPKSDYALKLPSATSMQTNIVTAAVDDTQEVPYRISRTPGLNAWFGRNTWFKDKKAHLYIRLRSKEMDSDEQAAILGDILVSLLSEKMATDIALAGHEQTSFAINHIENGIDVDFSGHPIVIDRLLERVIAELSHFRVKENDFYGYVYGWEEYLKYPENLDPLSRSGTVLNQILSNPGYDNESLLYGLRGAELPKLLSMIDDWRSSMQITSLAYGNVDLSQAVKWRDRLAVGLARKLAADLIPLTATQLPRSIQRYTEQSEYSDSVVRYYVQGDSSSIDEHTNFSLLDAIAPDAFFNELRNEQQLGYVVDSSKYPVRNFPGFTFVLQSPVASAETLERKIQIFIGSLAGTIDNLSEDKFQAYKLGLIKQLKTLPTQSQLAANLYWSNIVYGFENPDLRELLIAGLEQRSLEQLKQWYREQFLLNTSRQLSLLIEGKTMSINSDWLDREKATLSRSVSDLKDRMSKR